MISDETVEKACAAFWKQIDMDKEPPAYWKAMRAALEAVLPDIERPLQDEVKWRDAEIKHLRSRLVERDREIERKNRLLSDAAKLHIEQASKIELRERQIVECLLSKVEIEALLAASAEWPSAGAAYRRWCTKVNMANGEHVTLKSVRDEMKQVVQSARAKLEAMK